MSDWKIDWAVAHMRDGYFLIRLVPLTDASGLEWLTPWDETHTYRLMDIDERQGLWWGHETENKAGEISVHYRLMSWSVVSYFVFTLRDEPTPRPLME